MTDKIKTSDFVLGLRKSLNALEVKKNCSQRFRLELSNLLAGVKIAQGLSLNEVDTKEVKSISKDLEAILAEMPKNVRTEIDQLLADPVVPSANPNASIPNCLLPKNNNKPKKRKKNRNTKKHAN